MAGSIQNADLKTEAELIAAGAAASDLPSDTKIYLSGQSKKLSTALSDGTIKVSKAEHNAGSSGATLTIDLSNGLAQKVTMTNNCTFTLTNPMTGADYQLKLIQDATGGWGVTWPGSVKWPLGLAPSLSVATKIDFIRLYWDGANYFGTFNLNY